MIDNCTDRAFLPGSAELQTGAGPWIYVQMRVVGREHLCDLLLP
jgi:hypothetical protein